MAGAVVPLHYPHPLPPRIAPDYDYYIDRPEYEDIHSPVCTCGSCAWTPEGCTGECVTCGLTGNTVSPWGPACSFHTNGQMNCTSAPSADVRDEELTPVKGMQE